MISHYTILLLHTRWNGCLVHLTKRTHVIIRHPFPQSQLLWQQHWMIIQYRKDILYLNTSAITLQSCRFGNLLRNSHNQRHILLALTKRHIHATTHLDTVVQMGWYMICECALQRQGQQTFGKHAPYLLCLLTEIRGALLPPPLPDLDLVVLDEPDDTELPPLRRALENTLRVFLTLP